MAVKTGEQLVAHMGLPSTVVLDDSFYVCSDCLMVIANGDYTGLDYYNHPGDPDCGDRRKKEIDDGLDDIIGIVVTGDSEKEKEFSDSNCECCHSALSGRRNHCVILGSIADVAKLVEQHAHDPSWFEEEVQVALDVYLQNNPPTQANKE